MATQKETSNFTIILSLLISFGVFVGIIGLVSNDHLSFFTNSALRKSNLLLSDMCHDTHDPKSCLAMLAVVASSTGPVRTHDISRPLQSTLLDSIIGIRKAIDISRQVNDSEEIAAVDVCVSLFDMSFDRILRSMKALGEKKSGSYDDVHTWLSAVLTNHNTCLDELDHSSTRSQMGSILEDLIARASTSLAMLVSLLSTNHNMQFDHLAKPLGGEFPGWVSTRDRKLIEAMRPKDVEPDVVVAQDGSGDYLTVAEAVASAPYFSERRYVIYVKRGVYDETIRIGSASRNIMLIGDGMDCTIITGSLNQVDGTRTFETPPLAVNGDGFIGQDIWFRNTAGPRKGQAVALRVSADKSVLNRCRMDGYQDTLYTHSLRQFYRDCEISGTVDFIFGNAAVVLQNCAIISRKPLRGQSNMVTAQSRSDPNQNTGISIQLCQILPSADLEPVKGSVRSYFGRPWRTYSRVVIMESYVDDHIDPEGWHQWNRWTNVEALYYGEYVNKGPGACTDDRVDWPGFHVISDPAEAMDFTVAELIQGRSWLGSTGVDYIEGLGSLPK